MTRIQDATLDALEWRAVCARVARETSAPAARRALTAWRPLPDRASAETALAEVAEGMDLSGEGNWPAPHVDDQEATVRALAIEGAALEGPALVSAARTLEGVRRLAAFLRRAADRWPRLAERFHAAPSEPDLERRILDSFDAEARLVDGASPALARARGDVRSRRRDLVEALDRLISRLPHVLVAADSRPTVREGRYVVPLRREALSEVPGIVHGESASGATIFLEPHAVMERNNALRAAEAAVRREEERILRELTAELAVHRGALEHAARLALHAETVLARARYALAVDGHPPVLGGDALRLVDARHPLLLARLEDQGTGTVVPLSLDLAPEVRTLVVTGPNTGGKTVLLKTLGTVVLMAQAGMVPPVGRGTAIPWHDAVFADIGDAQSIAEDLSSFTAHLTRLRAALQGAGAGSLILVDEIGSSTDPAEGAALAAALLETWTDTGARTVVTSHFHSLKALAAGTPGMLNGSLAYDVDRNVPRYRFVHGVPGRSFGLELAQRWGFGEVVRRARDHLDPGIRQLDQVVDRLAAEERAYADSRAALDAERAAIGAAESARARRIAREESERRQKAERRLEELEGQLARLREEVRAQQRKLRERTMELAEAEAAAGSARALAAEAERASEALMVEQAELRATRPVEVIEVGDRVRIPRYDLTGEVVELDRRADAAVVRAGQVRISCRATECEVVEKAADRAVPGEAVAASSGAYPDEESSRPIEVDLRGLTADEVAFPVAGALERAYHTGRPRIRFIHGKGTGVLRRRVAEILSRHPYVQDFRLGRWNEGGDGVTFASLDGEEDEA